MTELHTPLGFGLINRPRNMGLVIAMSPRACPHPVLTAENINAVKFSKGLLGLPTREGIKLRLRIPPQDEKFQSVKRLKPELNLW